MALIRPERVVFGSTDDLIDYVSRGLPPTKKQYTRFMDALCFPMTDDQVENANYDEVVISDRLFEGVDTDMLNDVLSRVYHNNVHNRNVTIAVIVGGIIVAILVTMKIA